MTIQEIKNARSGRKIRDYGPEEGATKMVDVISRCYLNLGVKKSEQDIAATATQVYWKVARDNGGLTIEEVDLACTEGLFNSTEKVLTVSPVQANRWIQAYLSSDEYRMARQEASRPVALIESKTSSSDPDEAAKGLLRKDYEDYLANGEFKNRIFTYPRGTFVYDYLVKIGIAGTDSWKELIKEAESSYYKRNGFDAVSPEKTTIEQYAKALFEANYIKGLVDKKSARPLPEQKRIEEIEGDLPE